MAPTKKENEEDPDSNLHKIKPPGCCQLIPGPKYKLKTLVGYPDHCITKVREPAYTIAKRLNDRPPCAGPGPYNLKGLPDGPFYSFPKDKREQPIPCGPGPYMVKLDNCSPKYSIQGKWKDPCIPGPSGPYSPHPLCRGPAYKFGMKFKDPPCQFNPPMYDVGPVCLTRECPPKYSITPRRPMKTPCDGPGPKYMPNRLCKPKGYSFGLRHSPCEADNRTFCDEMC